MAKINRQERARLATRAAQLRRAGQRAGRTVDQIVGDITKHLPAIGPLEAWRLAYGWTRPEVVAGIADIFQRSGLAAPGLAAARLCRWEHDGVEPDPDYAVALVQLYGATHEGLGLRVPRVRGSDGYRQPHQPAEWGYNVADTGLTAIVDSIELQRGIEGPAGGPNTREQLDRACAYFNTEYAKYPMAVLSQHIHRCRALVIDMTKHAQTDAERTHLRTIGGWLSGQLGDIAFMLSDYQGASIHLATSTRLSLAVNDRNLTTWSYGAQSMMAWFKQDYTTAFDMAQAAKNHASTTLRHAQATAWCELRVLASMGRRTDTLHAVTTAQRSMDAADEDHSRTGFDRAELHQHIAEAVLNIGDTTQAKHHATEAIALKTVGSGGWAAATTILGQALAAEHSAVDAAAVASSVLDAVPPASLRESTRKRLAALDTTLHEGHNPGPAAVELRERLAALPTHTAPTRTSPEPNGH